MDSDMYSIIPNPRKQKKQPYRDIFSQNQQDEQEQYEQITIELVKQNKKFCCQEQANSYLQTSLYTSTFNSTQPSLSSIPSSTTSSLNHSKSNIDISHLKQQIKIYSEPFYFLRQSKMLFQWFNLFNHQKPALKLVGFPKILGSGSSGSVNLDFLYFEYPNGEIKQEFVQGNLIPVALKQISDQEQYKREVMIMEQLKYDFCPKLIYCDHFNQTICMELCICTLEEFSMIPNNPYLKSDAFSASLLLRLMKRIVETMKQNIIHGDIKPQNSAFAIRNNQVEIVLIDFGASTNSPNDYCNYYTKAYCNKKVLDIVCSNLILDIDTILFNELFCACRTMQYMLLNNKKSPVFKQENIEMFRNMFHESHPLTTSIINIFFGNQSCQFSYIQFEQLIQYYQSVFKEQFDIDIKYLLNNSNKFIT